MAASQTFTGRQGQAQINNNIVPITKWTAKITRQYADSTDSSTYNPVTGQTWETQAPGTVVAEGTVEGNFDLATTNADILALFASDGPYQAEFWLNRATPFISGLFNFMNMDVTVNVPGATMCTWTCDMKSSGIPTFY